MVEIYASRELVAGVLRTMTIELRSIVIARKTARSIGILFSFFNWYLLLATSFVLVFFHLQIVNVEEEFLLEAFGEEYLEYKKKVFRYIGRRI